MYYITKISTIQPISIAEWVVGNYNKHDQRNVASVIFLKNGNVRQPTTMINKMNVCKYSIQW